MEPEREILNLYICDCCGRFFYGGSSYASADNVNINVTLCKECIESESKDNNE